MADQRINHKEIAEKWQKRWEDKKAFEVKEDTKRKKFYVLEMYPYPSASGLHMGHALNYTIGDIYARFKIMQGYNVLHPMGFDSFGLPAENAAIKAKSHPKIFTEQAIKNYIKQMKGLGLSYDWSRMVETHKPEYYKWDQWIFLQMYKKGLVYKKKASVNWCSECNTVLANEQVHNGKCWRHEQKEVEVKELSQWFLKITAYADELYEEISKLEGWPDTIKKLQTNWINKSYGTEIKFSINKKDWPIFTTRPDTLFGVTFMVVAATHPRLKELVTKDNENKVEEFLKKIHSTKEEDMETLEKEGVFTGSYAEHPFTKEKIPVYAGNFVLADYGSGMVMAVPAHDQRDFEFAKKYNIPIKQVINSEDGKANVKEKAFTDYGILVNSEKFSGITSEKAIEEITKELEKKKMGKKTVNFRLKDWLISRQRYWGTPIPVYYDEKGEPHPVDEKDLPILLPEDVVFKEGVGNPVETSKTHFYKKNGKKYKLETDTMDTFVNSSWYFLRYCDPKNQTKIFDNKKANYWCPIDQYIGGKEHACMHLIYIRFYTKFLRDLGLIKFDEPAFKLFNQGMLQGEDGFKMSKSRGNVVLPEAVSEKYGLDAARLFLVSVASPDKDINWSDKGAEGSSRFINRVFSFAKDVKFGKSSSRITSKVHKTIKEYTEDLENMKYNLATIKLRDLFESFDENISKEDFENFILLLSPICPHSAEELWEMIGNKSFVSLQKWPKYDERFIDEKADYFDKVLSNLKQDIRDVINLIKIQNPKEIKIIVSPQWKYDFAEEFKSAFSDSKEFKTILQRILGTELKKYGPEIMKIIPALLKDSSKLPEMKISSKEEKAFFKENILLLEKDFGCVIIVEDADSSKEQKARNAWPGKPSIVIN